MMKTSSAELQQYGATVEENTENWAPPASTRNTILYLMLIAGIAVLMNYFFINNIFRDFSYAGLMYPGAFFLLGLIHTLISPKWLPHLWQKKFSWGTLYTLLIIALYTGSLFLFLNDMDQIRLTSILAASAFLLPYSIYATVHYFRSIGTDQYQPWFIPPDVEPDTRMSLLLNSIHFKIRICIKHGDATPTNFVITLPLRLKLSAVFIRFLYDKHDVIELTDSNSYPYGWLFWVKRGWRKKMLDPELTLRENGIKEDDIITIERVAE